MRDELASRAALTGRSLQEYLRAELVELARQPDAEVLIRWSGGALQPVRVMAVPVSWGYHGGVSDGGRAAESSLHDQLEAAGALGRRTGSPTHPSC